MQHHFQLHTFCIALTVRGANQQQLKLWDEDFRVLITGQELEERMLVVEIPGQETERFKGRGRSEESAHLFQVESQEVAITAARMWSLESKLS